jgi:hypothetical protein
VAVPSLWCVAVAFSLPASRPIETVPISMTHLRTKRRSLCTPVCAVVQALVSSVKALMGVKGRGLHSSTSQLNLSRVSHNKPPCTPSTPP